MPPSKITDPWPLMRDVVTAVVNGLHRGRFIEDTLEALCVQLGAASAWSTLETKGGGPMHRSRTASFQGVSPAILATHVTEVLRQVQTKLKTVAGPVPYTSGGSFIAVPLWSHPTASPKGRSLIGAMYMEFLGDEGTQSTTIEFVEMVGALLGGMIAQQTLIETTREDLRVERAKDHNEHYLGLDELLAPDSMSAIREELHAAIAGKASIMILGESGTGKTQLATAFARASNQEPIVRATLGFADDLNTITSELFGHERGSFSGAIAKRKGLVEYADGGTLILDEVLNLPPHAQQLLLDFTQFGSYRPLGYQGREPKSADLRLISVTNGDVQEAVSERRFRQDLYYRLATVPIVLPPLRERRWDIPKIAVRYLNRTDGETDWELDGEASELLASPRLEWAGNIRELEAVLERARNRARASASKDPVVEARHLNLSGDGVIGESKPPSIRPSDAPGSNGIQERWQELSSQKQGLDGIEKAIIEDALAACAGIVARTARVLSVPRTGLISRMATLEIDPEKFKERRG
ncbi:MAG: sigma-54-dependent Fis family transcriptional regulator [Deltaproteobacteria bacterium]|nr:sigma-54-dependent Fis family transcriptional regulator [Deltaproteobacteria bacterium]